MDRATQEQASNDRSDNKRAFRWGAIAVAVLVVAALGYNMVSHERAGPLGPETPTATQQRRAPTPDSGGTSGAAGPGTAAGTNTGAATGTSEPRK